jgi:hypothetical protein
MKKVIMVALLTASTSAWADQPHYLCVAEQSSGFHYDKQNDAWRPQVFAAGAKYIFRRVSDDDRDKGKGGWRTFFFSPENKWAFFKFEDQIPFALCNNEEGGICRAGINPAVFEKGSLRFEIAHFGFYAHQGWLNQLRQDDPEKFKVLVEKNEKLLATDDMFIEIGKCNPF